MAFDRLEAMRAFCRIVEVGSFSRAAESLNLAKTTVSGQVQALEHVAGYCVINDVSEREFQLELGGTWDKGVGAQVLPRRNRADHHPDWPGPDAPVPVAGEQKP